MTGWKSKRFWKAADVVEGDEGFEVRLDGRTVRTPGKSAVVVPTRGMAEAIALEWDAQQDEIDPLSMPVTRSANAAIERVRPFRGEVVDMIAAYGETDLLCYRAEAPGLLSERQAERWDPMLVWAENALGARLAVTEGVVPISQDARSLEVLRAEVAGYSDFEVTALHDLVTLSGSLVLGLAVARDRIGAQVAFELSRIDEEYQVELWGRDAEADAAAQNKREQFLHADRFFRLSSQG